MQSRKHPKTNRSNRQRQGQRRINGATAQRTNTTYNYGRALVPQLPREFEFSSAYNTYDIRATNTTPSVKIFGLMDFYNQLPSYAAAFYQIYKFARINAVTVHCECIATTAPPMIIAATVLPYSQANSSLVDPHFIASRPRAVSKVTGGSAGTSKVTWTKTWKTTEELGQLNYSDSAWQSYSEAISVTPSPDNPFICIATDSLSSADTWGAMIRMKVTYHMQFFELQDTGLTTKRSNSQKPKAVREEMDDETDSFQSKRNRRRD
jgi:hypothetical protein